MKTSIYSLAILLIFGACKSAITDSKVEIIGTYTKSIDQDYAKGTDTIRILPFDENLNKYKVIKSSYYYQVIDGKTLPPRLEKHEWMAIYEPGRKELVIASRGKIYHFDPDTRKLVIGQSEYSKVIEN